MKSWLILLPLITTVFASSIQSIHPNRLRTEYLDNPPALGTTRPRFSWQIMPDIRDTKAVTQTAYEIGVRTSCWLIE